MENADRGPGGQPQRPGSLLREQREARGLSLADIGARTRIPVRHLEAIEASDYDALPSPAYAVGFAKAHARAIGVDEVSIGRDVRDEVARMGRRQPEYEPYIVTDPERVPSRGVAFVGAAVALAVIVLVGLWFGTDWFRGSTGGEAAPVAVVASVPTPPPAAQPTPPTVPQVALIATDEVWLRVYDAAGRTLFTGIMVAGQRFDVPRDASDPRISVGRPRALTVALNGSAVPLLGEGERPIRNVRVGADALAARFPNAGAQSPQGG